MNKILRRPTAKQVEAAARDHRCHVNQPKHPKRGEFPAADRLCDFLGFDQRPKKVPFDIWFVEHIDQIFLSVLAVILLVLFIFGGVPQ